MKLKTLISVLLTVTFVFSFVPCFAAVQNRVTDDFQNYTSTANEGGVWSGARPIVNEGGNKSAIIGAGNGDTLYAATSGFSSDVTGIIAGFSIKFNDAVKQNVIFGAASSSTPVGAAFRLLQFYAGGNKMQIAASKDINISYTTGKWYDIKLQLNYNTGYYYLSVYDGTQTKTWSTTQTSLIKNDTQKAALKYYSFWIDSNTAAESVQIDNVDIFGTTDNRIYPVSSEIHDFESYVSADGTTVPQGFESDSVLESDNGFIGADGTLRFVSASDKSLFLTRTFDTALTPPNVKMSLKSASLSDCKITLTDSTDASEELTVSSDGISLAESDITYPIGDNTEISITIKDGKLRIILSDSNGFSTAETDTALGDLKYFVISSPQGTATDISLESLSFATSTFFELGSSSVDGAGVLPDTYEIELKFSNKLVGGTFTLTGDRTIEDVIYSGNKVTLLLDDVLSPDTAYELDYTAVYDIEGCPLSGKIAFKTDVAIYAEGFDIGVSSDAYTLDTNLKSNTGSAQSAVLLLTAYDNTTGKIVSMDFKNISIDTVSHSFSLALDKPAGTNYSIEAYIWDGFGNMKSLGYTDIQGGATE